MLKKQYDRVEEREKVFELMDLNTKHVLDLGTCGCDCMTMILAKNGFRVTPVDNSEEKLAEAKEFAQQEGLSESIDFRHEDAANLSFADGSFEAVVAYNLLHHCDDVDGVVSEMFRVCKPDGKIIIAELNADGRREAEHRRDRRFLKKVQKLIEKQGREFEVFDLDFTRVWIVRR